MSFESKRRQFDLPTELPEHVAIIMDGNGRWAKAKGWSRIRGHRQGAVNVNKITTFARSIGIRYLTLYAFSQQNFKRPADEVSGLMKLLIEYVRQEWKTVLSNGIRLQAVGEVDRLPKATRKALNELIEASAKNRGMVLTLALAYGGREEIRRACKQIAIEVQHGSLQIEDIDEHCIANHLYTHDMPDPDLLIRTSGECRISNFLLWQIAYSELHLSPLMWPEFDEDAFCKALQDFTKRERRFGMISEQIQTQLHG